MNPSHDDFSGSGLPPYMRHGQDQGQQQLASFPFRFQNNHLSTLNEMERNREFRELQDRFLLRQELERQQRALSEQNDFMNHFMDSQYSQHHQQAMSLHGHGNQLFLSAEDRLRIQQAASQQALFQRQQQELNELNERRHLQMQNLLLSRINVDEPIQEPRLRRDSIIQNEIMGENDNDARVNQKRKRSISNSSSNNINNDSKTGMRKKKHKKNKNESETQSKSKCGADDQNADNSIDLNVKMTLKSNTSDSQEVNQIETSTEALNQVSSELHQLFEIASKTMNSDKNDKPDTSYTIEEEFQGDSLAALIQAAKTSTETNFEVSADGKGDVRQLLRGSFTDGEAAKIMNLLKETAERDPTAAAYFGLEDVEKLEISPGYFAIIPRLPVEPEYDESKATKYSNDEVSDEDNHDLSNQIELIPKNVSVPTLLPTPTSETSVMYDIQTVDNWFPSSSSIRKERRSKGVVSDEIDITLENSENDSIRISDEMNNRLRSHIEPGVYEKIPHCRLHYESYLKQNGKPPKESLFCCQVTETYCTSTILCCSVCSTWRHAECGGHYTHYSTKNIDELFAPVCDRCHLEKPLLENFPLAERRISRQRCIQLRTVQAITAMMRNSAYSKHGGTYKWPLGSVSPFLIGSHTKSIHLRHERAEKQWKEMAAKLNGISTKGKNTKSRTRDFERLMVNLEDAEGQTDRHNMTLFLQWDTERECPVGFEKPYLNFFDPAEDDRDKKSFHFDNTNEDDDNYGDGDDDNNDEEKKTESQHSSSNTNNNNDNECQDDEDHGEDISITSTQTLTSMSLLARSTNENKGRIIGRSAKVRHSPRINKQQCIRLGCNKKPRFDSAFCSDGCGVTTMEKDLLCSLQYASNMHPYELRP